MANKISTVIDFATESAKSSLKSLQTSVMEAEGAGGKLKAGWGSLKQGITENAAGIATVAGGALLAFGVKAVGAFTDTAKAAIDLSTSTGLAVEDASRWIAVGDDYKVGADALATGLGKIAKTLDDTKWSKYGIATRDAGGQARSTNDILLDTFDMLSKVTNKTEQARIGQQLFGKGYQSITPILGHTRAEYEKMLGTVEKGQVITEAEAKKAEKFRLAEDQLGDALRDVTIQIGEQVAGMAPLLVAMAKLVAMLSGGVGDFLDFNTGAGDVINTLYELRGEADRGGKSWESWRKDVLEGKVSLEEAVKQIHEAAAAHKEINDTLDGGEKSWEQATALSDDLTDSFEHMGIVGQDSASALVKATQRYADQVDKTSREVQSDIDAMQHKWDTLFNNLDAEQSLIHLKQQAEDVKKANEDAGKAIKEHGPGSPEAIAAIADARDKQIELEKATALYAKDIAGLPPEVATRIAAEIGAGDIDKAIAEVEQGFQNHAFRINAHLDTIVIDGETHAAGSTSINGINVKPSVGKSASGRDIPSGEGLTLVGEKGPELISSPGSQVWNADQTAAMLNGGSSTTVQAVNIYVTSMPTPDDVMRLVKKFEQRNGPGWRS